MLFRSFTGIPYNYYPFRFPIHNRIFTGQNGALSQKSARKSKNDCHNCSLTANAEAIINWFNGLYGCRSTDGRKEHIRGQYARSNTCRLWSICPRVLRTFIVTRAPLALHQRRCRLHCRTTMRRGWIYAAEKTRNTVQVNLYKHRCYVPTEKKAIKHGNPK